MYVIHDYLKGTENKIIYCYISKCVNYWISIVSIFYFYFWQTLQLNKISALHQHKILRKKSAFGNNTNTYKPFKIQCILYESV